MKNKYLGIYDYKESDTFRPTLETRVHIDAKEGKTLTCRSDSFCIIESGGGKMEDLGIRRITPRECFRLMGVKDQDATNVMEHQTEAQSYHLAGDSIVTTCLMAIFGQMLDIDWQEKIKPEEWWKNE